MTTPTPENNVPPSTRRRPRRVWKWLLIVVVSVLIGSRVALPYVLEHYVNQQLGSLHGYTGSIGTVRVHLWRGAYAIHDIQISQTGGTKPVPLFSGPVLDLSLQWRELFHGALVGKVFLQGPVVNFVQSGKGESNQTGFNQPWVSTLNALFPFDINRMEITNGEVHFRNAEKMQVVDVYVTNLWAVATNLSNSRDLTQRLPAGLEASGKTLGHGEFHVQLNMDLQDAAPTFELATTITNLDLPSFNDFLRTYAKLDVARGNLSIYSSLASVHGKYDGYVKVLCNQLQVFSWDKERKKDILEVVWEAIAGTLAAGFKNHPHDQLAAQIPVTGQFEQVQVHTWGAIGSMLGNAFIKALRPQIEPFLHVTDVDKKNSQSNAAVPSDAAGKNMAEVKP
jgi:hypothetical protein